MGDDCPDEALLGGIELSAKEDEKDEDEDAAILFFRQPTLCRLEN